MDKVLNLNLLLSPMNWAIVLSITLLMGWAYTHIVENGKCNCADNGIPD